MLNDEQKAYIDTLKRDYQHIDDATLRETLKNADWIPEEISEALERFSSKPVLNAETATATVSPVDGAAESKAETTSHQNNSAPTTNTNTSSAESIVLEKHNDTTSAHGAVNTTPTTQARNSTPSPTRTPLEQTIHTTDSAQGDFHKNTGTSILRKAVVSLGILLGLGALAAGGYYVVTKTSIFTPHKLTNENIFSTIFSKLAEIKETSYTVSLSITTNPRAEGAEPFNSTKDLTEEELLKYRRDQDRIRDIVRIKNALDQTRLGLSDEYSRPYPATLTLTGIRTADALGKPYVYTRNADGTGYTLSVTFETLDAVVALENNSYNLKKSSTTKINGTTVTFDQDDYVAEHMFNGKPQKPRILGLFDMAEIENFLPENFSASIESSGTIDTATERPLYGKFGIKGEVAFGDTQFVFDAEGLKHGEDYYGVIHKLPAFFGPYSKLRETWVHITEEDLKSYGYDTYLNEILPTGTGGQETHTEEYREQIWKLIELADTYGLLVLNGEGEAVTFENQNYTKYTLSLVPEKFLPFYEEAIIALKTYEHPLVADNVTAREYLKSENAQALYTYLKDNFTVTLLIDSKGFPVQLNLTTRYIPSDEAPALEGTQIDSTLSITLRDINKQVTIVPPDTARSLDDVIADITGKSKQEILIERQERNIQSLRNALDTYYEWAGVYPAFLEDLKKPRNEVTRAPLEIGSEHAISRAHYDEAYGDVPFIKHIPSDVFTSAIYDYTSRQNASDYELAYTIQLPLFNSETNPDIYYTYDMRTLQYSYRDEAPKPLLVPRYVEGRNIATKNASSQATLETLNSDIDDLSDGLEKLIGTNPMKSDTDGDSFSDSEELRSGSNPLGAGRLKDGYSSSLIY